MAQVKLEYYQSDTKVVVTLFEKNLEESKVNVICEPKTLKVVVGERVLLNTSLYGEVISDEVVYSVKPRKIEISLKKKDNSHWDTLEDKRKDAEDAKKVPTDKWSNLIRETEKEEEEAGDIQGVFQKIFKNCDDDAKRAMLKSYTESKGTVLSTNWSDIGKKTTEIKPPDSMEYIPPEN